MEITRGTAYGLGLSQFAVTLAAVLFFPPVDVDVYFLHGHINLTTRGISITPDADMKGLRVFMAMPVLLASALAAEAALQFTRRQAVSEGLMDPPAQSPAPSPAAVAPASQTQNRL